MEKTRSQVWFSKDSWLTMIILGLVCVLLSFLMVKVHMLIGPLLIGAILGVGFLVIVMRDYRIAFYAALILTSILFFLDRALPVGIPWGVACDALFLLAFFALVLDQKEQNWGKYLMHPLSIAYSMIFVYHLLQVFNTNAISLRGWAESLRVLVSPFILYTAIAMVRNVSGIKLLLKIWLVIAVLAGIYGLYQEIFGLPPWDLRWVNADIHRFRLIFILGRYRKFSFLSDPSAFGMFMSFSSIAVFVLMFLKMPWKHRLGLLVCFIIMVMAMLYSGTRTAYATLVLGIVFYLMISIRKKVTFIVATILIGIFVTVMYGPFYSAPILRLRSTFEPNEDASMQVRDVKRIKWQSYVWKHPFGGGVNTTGVIALKVAKGHELAGDWDADSGFLRQGLEQGIIGLALLLGVCFLVMVRGIINYFKLQDPMLQQLNLAFLIPFFIITVGNYTQNAMTYKPLYIIVICTYAVILSLEKFEKIKRTKNETVPSHS